MGIPGRPNEPDPQTRCGTDVPEKAGRRPVLSNRQIDSSVPVEVPERGTTTVPVDTNTGLLTRHRHQRTRAIPA